MTTRARMRLRWDGNDLIFGDIVIGCVSKIGKLWHAQVISDSGWWDVISTHVSRAAAKRAVLAFVKAEMRKAVR